MDLKDKNIVVIGSGMTGLETAEYLASKGNNVTVVEMLKQIGPDVYDVVLYDIITRLKKIKCKLNAFQQICRIWGGEWCNNSEYL